MIFWCWSFWHENLHFFIWWITTFVVLLKLLTKWQVPSATFLWYVFKSIYHVLSTYLSFRKYYWICVLLATTLRQYHELIWKKEKGLKKCSSPFNTILRFFYLQSRLNRVLPWENKLLRARKKSFVSGVLEWIDIFAQ